MEPGCLQTKIVLGSVPYLNVQPMLWAVQNGMVGRGKIDIVSEVPRQLSDKLAAGAYDSAIVPVFEYFRHPQFYTYIPGPVIATHGAVASVALFSSDPWDTLHTVYLDASSLTSVHLFKVLAAEAGLKINYLDTSEHAPPRPLPPGCGWVLIGDPAIAESDRHPHTLDLGLAWKDLTRLPFVFAAWLVPQGIHSPGMTALLNESLRIGLDNLEQVAMDSAARFGVSSDFALRYFKNNIHYHLGDRELAGWTEFGRLCHKHGLIAENPVLRPYRES